MKLKYNGHLLTHNGQVLDGDRQPPNPVLHWTFNNTLTDQVQGVTFTTDTGLTPNYVSGKAGNCIQLGFDASVRLLNSTDSAILDVFGANNSFTMSYWTYTSSTQYGDPWPTTGGLDVGAVIGLEQGSLGLSTGTHVFSTPYPVPGRFRANRYYSTFLNDGPSEWHPSFNTWYFVVLMYDGDTDLFSGYVNNGAITLDPSTIISTGSLSAGNNFELESRRGFWQLHYYYGAMSYFDELRLYNTTLNEDERAYLWNGGSGI